MGTVGVWSTHEGLPRLTAIVEEEVDSGIAEAWAWWQEVEADFNRAAWIHGGQMLRLEDIDVVPVEPATGQVWGLGNETEPHWPLAG